MPILTNGIQKHATLPQSTASSPSSSPPPPARRALYPLRPSKRNSFTAGRLNGHSNLEKNYLASASSPDSLGDETETDVQRAKPENLPSNGAAFASHSGSASPNGLLGFRPRFTDGDNWMTSMRSSTPKPGPASNAVVAGPSSAIVAPRRPSHVQRRPSFLHPSLFPKTIELHVMGWTYSLDSRRAGESLFFILPFVFALYEVAWDDGLWLSTEVGLMLLISITVMGVSARRGKLSVNTPVSALSATGSHESFPFRPQDASGKDVKHPRKAAVSPSTPPLTEGEAVSDVGLLWMTEERDYRECVDSGIFTALLFGPFLAMVSLLNVSGAKASESLVNSPKGWLIEDPLRSQSMSSHDAVVRSRRNLVQFATFCSLILAAHLEMSRRAEIRGQRADRKTRLPKSEWRRLGYYVAFVLATTTAAAFAKLFMPVLGLNFWSELPLFDVIVASLFYQFCLYVMVRLARRGFTLGELGFVAQAATALFMETVNLTISRIWPLTTPFIKTYRFPTPLLIFQLAMIPGSLLAGFLLSPLLVLSRHIAQTPSYRLRFPKEKQMHRRALAVGVYAGFALVIGGIIGTWARWCLGWRNPWIWAIYHLFDGRRSWSRLVLLFYWGLLGSISVAGWNRQLARVRRYRHLHTAANGSAFAENSGAETPPNGHGPAGNTPAGTASSTVSEMLDAADKHVPTLGLNGRRKFFHALAVLMFLPGITFDPAFTHLAFSAAFALFTFAEYVRYFALYPFGAAVHVFLSEFLDHRDSGTAILSHFYLLTGCAGSLWLEGASPILGYTGVLVLGVGDALASIVGKRVGRLRWSSSSPKTVEGTAAFALSVIVCACALRICGLVEPFSIFRYTIAAAAAGVLEALSMQNDNLTLPLYMWCLLVLLDV